MRLTHFDHSCLLVEMADTRILLDPGGFSAGFEELRDLDAILVTHQHPDHLDQARFVDLVRANPGVQVVTDPGTAGIVRDLGVDVREQDGSAFAVGEVEVTPVGQWHALIHEEIPLITNVGVRLAAAGEPSLFHPGDALDGEPGHVDVLAFPLNAPWQRSREMTAFLRRLAAPVAVPIHDGLLQTRGRNLYLGQAKQLGCPDTDIRDLAGAGEVEIRL